jgi:transcription-repair coupling factor (superfamily II helicase)
VNFYQRLAHLSTTEQVETMAAEMNDRFGAPPSQVQNLLTLVRLKVEAAHMGYESIALKDNEFILTVRRTIVPNRIALYRRFRNDARVQQGIIHVPRRLLGQNWLEQLQNLLPEITSTASSKA